jgi:anti-sigma regulatory factor (Ser/Thr protein kinase)
VNRSIIEEDGLELALNVSPPMVSSIRHFVEAITTRQGVNSDLSARAALTAHELFENVAKYGEARHGVLKVYRAQEAGQSRLVVTVTNRTSARHAERLREIFREMEDSADPTAYYFVLMGREVAANESGLGLARIRAEAEMDLMLTIDHETVSITATSPPFAPFEEAPR